MPAGAGAASVAWTPESDYLGGPTGSPTYYLPGANVQTQDIEIERNLATIRVPDDVEAKDWVAQNFDGALGIQFVLTDDNFHRLVFNSSFTGFTSGAVNSAEWYLGADLSSGSTVERQVKGWAPGQATINYSGTTELTTATLTGPYGDEEKNTSLTPGSLVDNTGGDEVPGHGAELQVNGSRITKLTDATITFSDISRLIPDSNTLKPVDAVAGPVQQSVSLSAIYDGSDLYELALGGSAATSVQDFVDAASFTATFDRDGTTIADFTFDTVKPTNYNWSDLVTGEPALGEEIEFNATSVTASDPTI